MDKPSFLTWSIHRPITILMLFITILVTGGISLSKIPLQLLPSGYTPPYLSIRVPYENSNPVDVERLITRPIEEMLGTVAGIQKIRSRSSAEGSRVLVKFSSSVDMDQAYALLYDRMERLRGDLPEDIERYTLRKFNFNDMPILFVGLYAANASDDLEGALQVWVEKAETLQKVLIPRLEQEAGVAQAELFGTYDQRVAIYLNRAQVESHAINVPQLIQKLRAVNADLTAGEVVENNVSYTVRSLGKFANVEELKNFPVAEGVRLKDIAAIGLARSVQGFRVRINGQPAAFAEVYKESTANTVDICRRVEKTVTQMLEKDPRFSDFSFEILHNEGAVIEDALITLMETLFWGALFAVLILFFFLRQVKMTAIITLSIPFSLLMTLIVVYFRGGTINILALMGFTLAVGMLLDNSVVVVENIYRYLQQGLPIKAAAVKGVEEVGLAILLATSTTLVVFIPMILMEGDLSFKFFMEEMGAAVCFSLIASLLGAIVFIPVVVVYLQNHRENLLPHQSESRWGENCEKLIVWHLRLYSKGLQWCLRYRFETIFCILLPLVLATFWIAGSIGQTDQEGQAERSIRLRLKFTESDDVNQNSALMYEVEKVLLANQQQLEIKNVLAHSNEDRGHIRVWLTDLEDALKSTPEISALMEKLLPDLPGVEMRGSWQKRGGYRSEGGEEEGDIPIVLHGDDTEVLRELANEVQRRLEGLPGIESISAEEEEAQQEALITLDREKTQRYQVISQDVARTVGIALRGLLLSYLRENNREIPIQLEFSSRGLDRIAKLKDLRVLSEDKEKVAVQSVGDIQLQKGFGTIRRRDRKTSYTVNVTAGEDDLKELGEQIDQRLKTLPLPRGYSLEKQGRFAQMRESEEAFVFALLLGVVFVFLLMGFLFESILIPFAIIFSIPFAFIGVYWILYLTDTPMGTMPFLGCIVLAGVVVNNGIVLVDYINRLRRQGKDRDAAILEAGQTRFRPIMMTSLTTLIGLVPMAIGSADFVGTPYYPLGRTIIGGLAMSTFLTLLLIPVFYSFLDDLREALLRVTASVFHNHHNK